MLPVLLAALALAPPLAETPQLVLPGRTFGACPRATGVPGEIALETPTGVRFMEATRAGLRSRGEASLGTESICPEVSVRANGAAIVAGAGTGADYRDEVVATVRDPGGDWTAPMVLASSEDWYVDDVYAAVADSGDAVVAWTERHDDTERLRVTRRAPGETFGPTETIGRELDQEAMVDVGVAATGETILLTATVESSRLPLRVPVRVAIARRGESIPTLTGLGLVPWRSVPALAVAPDGRALVALPDGSSLLVAERAPGEPFGAPVAVGPAVDAVGVSAEVTLGPGGEAAAAWTGDEEHGSAIVTRRGPGPFTAPVSVRERIPFSGDPFFISQTFEYRLGLGSAFSGRDAERLVLTGDGHAALSGYRDDDVHGVYQQRASLATVALGGDRAETQVLGGVLGLSGPIAALSLADGTPALAWNERIDRSATIHLAAQGAVTPAEPPPPTVEVGAPVHRVVAPGEQLVLPVRCSGPCDVRGQALGGSRATGRLRLTRAGRGLLKLDTGSVPLAPRRLGPVRIRLTYGRVNTQAPSVRIVTVRLRRPPDPPEPRVVGLRAVRREDTIRVTWTVRHPVDTAVYVVTGAATRGWSGEPPAFDYSLTTNGRRSWSITLSPAGDVRWVTLRSSLRDAPIVIPVR